MSGRLLRVSEVARALAVSVTHVRRLIAAGELGVVWVGKRSPRVSELALAAFLRSRNARPSGD